MKKALCFLLLCCLMASLSGFDFKQINPLGIVAGSEAQNIQVENSLALVRNQNQLWVYSIFDVLSPRLEASFKSLHRIEDVNLQADNYIYVSSKEPSNTVTSIDSLNQFSRIYFINTVIGDKITREGATLYVADRYRGIDIINVGRGGSNDFLANFSEKWGIKDFCAEYPYIYALNDFGFVIVDISHQSFPKSISSFYQIGEVGLLAKDRDYVFIAGGKELYAFSIRDKDNPKLLAQMRMGYDIKAIEVKDSRLYLALGRGGIKVFDVSVPQKMEEINSYQSPFPALDIALEGELIFIAMGKEGWMVCEYR